MFLFCLHRNLTVCCKLPVAILLKTKDILFDIHTFLFFCCTGWLEALKEFSSVQINLQPLIELLDTIKPRWLAECFF